MAEKRVSVRLAAVGGRQVRAELEGVGEAGSRGFGRLEPRDGSGERPARGLLAPGRVWLPPPPLPPPPPLAWR